MNCFLLPIGLCDEINSMMGQFWWGQKNVEKKDALVKLEAVVPSKKRMVVWGLEI